MKKVTLREVVEVMLDTLENMPEHITLNMPEYAVDENIGSMTLKRFKQELPKLKQDKTPLKLCLIGLLVYSDKFHLEEGFPYVLESILWDDSTADQYTVALDLISTGDCKEEDYCPLYKTTQAEITAEIAKEALKSLLACPDIMARLQELAKNGGGSTQ